MTGLFSSNVAFGGPGYFTYEGFLTDNSDNAIDAPSPGLPMDFEIIGYSNGAECPLVKESRNVVVVNGQFAVRVGGLPAPVSSVVYQCGKSIADAYGSQTIKGYTGAGQTTCLPVASTNCTFDPAASDSKRMLRITVDGHTFQTLVMSAAPMAMVADRVGDSKEDDLVRAPGGTGTKLSATDWSKFLQLIAGTSTQYLNSSSSLDGSKLNSGSVDDTKLATGISASKISGDIAGKSAGFTGSLAGDVTGTQSATVVSRLQGRNVDATAPTDGQVLTWDQTGTKWKAATLPAAPVQSVGVASPIKNTGTSAAPILGVEDASTSQKGVVQLALGTDNAGGLVVQANDPRLTNSRTPTAHHHTVDEIDSDTGKYLSYKPNNTQCADGGVLKWNLAQSRWECGLDAGASGTVSSVSAGTGGVTITGTASSPIVNVSPATSAAVGVVQLTTGSSDVTAGHVVQADDTRLSNARAPSGGAGGDLAGSYPNPTLGLVGTAGTYYKVTTDTKGRVTAGTSTLDYGDIANAPSKYLSYKPNDMACGDQQVLKWDNTNTRWICSTAQSLINETNPGILNFAKNAPNSTDFSTTGDILALQTVGIAKGGTGLTSVSGANQILGANAAGTALEYKTLTQGSGISITHGAGTVTIAATGGSESTTASNIGTAGVGIFKTMSTTDLQFKKLNPLGALTIFDDTANNKVDIGIDLNGLAVNNTGLLVSNGTQILNKACLANQILKWLSPTGWTCASDDGLTGETDPKVGANTANYVSKWSGTALVSSAVAENGGNVGIGTSGPNYLLDIRSSATASSQIHLSPNVGDTGAYIGSKATDGVYVAGGAAWDGSNWIAKATAPVVIAATGSGGLSVNFDTGKAVNSVYTPTPKFSITKSGSVGIGTNGPDEALEVGFTAMPGTVSVNNGTAVVTGLGTTFLSSFSVNDYIIVGGVTRMIASITNDTQLIVSANYTASQSSASYTKTANVHADGQVFGGAYIVAAGSNVNFDNGNTQVLQNVGGSGITLSNMKDGGSYVLIVTDSTSRTYSFAGCTTPRYLPGNTSTTAGTITIYNILKVTISTVPWCFISWATGY